MCNVLYFLCNIILFMCTICVYYVMLYSSYVMFHPVMRNYFNLSSPVMNRLYWWNLDWGRSSGS